jgi:electron transfer flavoprotein-quinone oxidoreductase
MKDLYKYRDMPDTLHRNPQFFTTYPDLVNERAHDDHRRRRRQEDQGARDRVELPQSRSFAGLVGDAFKIWRAFR